MTTRSVLYSLGEDSHRAITGFGLAVITLVAFSYALTVLLEASSTTPITRLGSGFASLLVALVVLSWLVSIIRRPAGGH